MVNSLGYIPRSAIDAPYDNSSLPFEDLPNYFKSSYTSLHSQKQHSWFLYILANVCCFPVFFGNSHPNEFGSFDLHFLPD